MSTKRFVFIAVVAERDVESKSNCVGKIKAAHECNMKSISGDIGMTLIDSKIQIVWRSGRVVVG